MYKELYSMLYQDIENLYFSVAELSRKYIYHESCLKCRCWTYTGRHLINGNVISMGNCAWNTIFGSDRQTSGTHYCDNFNYEPFDSDTYTMLEDGHEELYVTPTGKEVTRISKNGRWLYLHDGKPTWWS